MKNKFDWFGTIIIAILLGTSVSSVLALFLLHQDVEEIRRQLNNIHRKPDTLYRYDTINTFYETEDSKNTTWYPRIMKPKTTIDTPMGFSDPITSTGDIIDTIKTLKSKGLWERLKKYHLKNQTKTPDSAWVKVSKDTLFLGPIPDTLKTHSIHDAFKFYDTNKIKKK